MYLNVIIIVSFLSKYIYIYINFPGKPRDVNITPHPTQTPKFTKHTWREQVNISPQPHPNPEVHEAYMAWASSQGL